MAIWFAVDVIVVVFFCALIITSAASHRAVINQRTRLIYFYSLTHSNVNMPTHKFADWPTELINITRSDVSERERVLRCGVILLIIFGSAFFCCCLQCSRNSFEIRFCTQHTTHGLKMKWGLKARDLLLFLRRMFAIKVLFVLWQTAGVCRCVTFCAVCARCESSDNFIDGR